MVPAERRVGARMLMRRLSFRSCAVLCCLPATAWAATAAADWLAQIALGLGEGVRRVGLAVAQWVWHPWLSVDGIALAFSDRRHGVEAWQEAITLTWAGLSADPAGATGTMVMWAVCAAGSVLVAAVLTGAGAVMWRWATRPRASPRRTDLVARLRRARTMREERRRGEVSARWGWWRSAGHGVADVLDTPRLLRRYGWAGVAFLLGRLRRALGRVAANAMRQLGRQFAYLALPLAMLAGPWIDLGVQREAAARDAAQTVVPHTQRFLAAVPGDDVASLVAQATDLRQRYAAHRQRLLAPFEGLDARLEADLSVLDQQVGGGLLADAVIYHRIDIAFRRFTSERLRWVGVLVWPLPDAAPDPLAVPRTWFESRAIEWQVFALARDRLADPAARIALDTVLTALDAEWAYDICLRDWNPNLLLKQPLPPKEAAEAQRQCGRRP